MFLPSSYVINEVYLNLYIKKTPICPTSYLVQGHKFAKKIMTSSQGTYFDWEPVVKQREKEERKQAEDRPSQDLETEKGLQMGRL